jgi:hypothetical protein
LFLHLGVQFSILAEALVALSKRTVGEKLGAPLTIATLVAYAVFVGTSASVVRAAIMCSLVVVAGRNGAADATSDAWLAAVQPSTVAISVKPDARTEPDARTVLPDPVLLQRLAGVPVWRTDEREALEWVSDGAELWVVTDH